VKVSGESMQPMGEGMVLVGLRESELRGWRREAGSWFQRRREAYWKERSVIRREDDVDGRASVTKDEQRVLRGGSTVMRYADKKVSTVWSTIGLESIKLLYSTEFLTVV